MLPAARRALVALIIPGALAVALATAGPALAECNPEYQVCDPGGTTRIYSNTLTVTKTAGTVTSAPSGISCGADCTHTDTQAVPCDEFGCDPDPEAWETLTLTASGGAAGYGPSWSGCDSVNGSGQCVVKLDDDRTVGLSWSDQQDPSVALTNPPNATVARNQLYVSATASDNAGVSYVRFRIDGVALAQDETAPYEATLDTSGYAHGSTHLLTAYAMDHNGRVAISAGRTFTIDRQVGLTVGSVPALTNGASVPVEIATDIDAQMACRIVGVGAPVGCEGPTWSGVDASTPDGSYTYEVRATDAAGNTAMVTRQFVLDRTGPQITAFDGPAEGGVVGTDRATFTFAVSDSNLDSVRCKIGSGAPGPCTSTTSHELTGLPDGPVAFSLIVTDKAGNQVTRTRSFFIQGIRTDGGGTTPSTAGTGGSSSATQAGPSGQRGELKANPAKLKFKKQRRAGRTRLLGLRLAGVPRGATITATCKGKVRRGCPRKAPKAIRKSGTVKLSAVARLKLRKGAVLTILVRAPGYAPKTLTVRI